MNNTKNNFSYFSNLGPAVEPSATTIPSTTTEKTPRILSAQKSQKNPLTKASLFTHNLLQESAFNNATSPIKYQSLQSDDLSPNHTSKVSLTNQTSPNATNSSSFFNTYFTNPRKSLVTNPLSIDATKMNTKNSPIVENLKLTTTTPSTKSSLMRRERGLPMSLSTTLEVGGKDADYRLLQPPPWLSNTHSKHSSNEKVGHLSTNKRMTDWKTMHNELNRLSITDTDNILLPTCPGASLSPKTGNRKKLTPMINSPEFHSSTSLNTTSNGSN
ncbi:uncharacterized protein LOC134832029 [Culicoides brevitarsis]|uniref:uncharacterized protein LOC134832029 n=1 Tax=Culicoides brevitarsis TaxID=469753 RepID=UPI00307BDDCA